MPSAISAFRSDCPRLRRRSGRAGTGQIFYGPALRDHLLAHPDAHPDAHPNKGRAPGSSPQISDAASAQASQLFRGHWNEAWPIYAIGAYVVIGPFVISAPMPIRWACGIIAAVIGIAAFRRLE